jgi:thiol:disulfide interchange protein DsbA
MRRIHLPFQRPTDPEAHVFLTLEAMDKLEEYHPFIFQAVHVQRQHLMKDDAIIDWATNNGLDRAKLIETWNSFAMTTKLRWLQHVSSNYKVTGTPTFIIYGKYVVSPDLVRQANNIRNPEQVMTATSQVLDALVARFAATKLASVNS